MDVAYNDAINGAMEFISAFIMLLNVRALYRDKGYAGISLLSSVLFDTWGFWNLYYYPSLDQWLSFAGGACLCAVNVWWTALAFYYGPKKK